MRYYVIYNGVEMQLQEYNKQVVDEYKRGFKQDNLGFKNFSMYLKYCLNNHFTDEEVTIFVK